MKSIKFYVSTEDKETLRKSFLNFRFYSLISVPDIIKEVTRKKNNLDDLTEHESFIVNKTIITEIEYCLKRKSFFAIIYQNDKLDYELIRNIHEALKDYQKISRICLLDYKSDPRHEDLWENFQEVTFFPEVRKKKIVECEKIKTPMFYWVNDLEIPDELKDND